MRGPTQLELIGGELNDSHVQTLLGILRARGWMTRKELVKALDWEERIIRLVAHMAGNDIVRGPKGFITFEQATAEEILHAARRSENQGAKMIAYGIQLRVRARARLST